MIQIELSCIPWNQFCQPVDWSGGQQMRVQRDVGETGQNSLILADLFNLSQLKVTESLL